MSRPRMRTRGETVELSERELRTLLTAMDIARDQTVNDGWWWWHNTAYAQRLYERLLTQGHGAGT